MRSILAGWASVLVALSIIVVSAAPDVARAQTQAQAVQLEIPAGDLQSALVKLAESTGVQLLYSAEVTRGLKTPGLSGAFTAESALQRLLEGTGLSYRFTSANTVTIEKAPKGARTLGAVKVEGVTTAAAGANGSTDPTATEGTGSLTTDSTTVASRGAPTSLKDTPQSVSVITQERIQQQNLTTLDEALLYTPGVTTGVVNGGVADSNYYSRGFEISTFQIDGGAPIDYNSNSYYQTTPNLAEFDHIEILRGSDALFGGAGDPGGVVTLERKRPLDHDQFVVDADAGSWDNYRIQMDATGPIGFDGGLRARLVTSYQDRDFFYDVAHQNKTFIYGVIEADLGPETLLRFGGSYERQDNPGFDFQGLPRYADGGDLDLPRSTCPCAPWNRWSFQTKEYFATLEHRFSQDWKMTVNATQLDQNSQYKYDYIYGLVTSVEEDTPESLLLYAGDWQADQLAVDATVTGEFNLWGLLQRLTIGGDYSRALSAGSYGQSFSTAAINFFDFDPTTLQPEPASPPTRVVIPRLDQDQWGGYARLDLHVLSQLHLLVGSRLSWYKWYDTLNFLNPSTGAQTFSLVDTYKDQAVTTPYAALIYDIDKTLSLYTSYADIYQSQASHLTVSGKPLPPITGATYEAGAKAAFMHGKLNASLAFYYSQQNNQGIVDPNIADPGTLPGETTGSSCCYLNTGAVTSKGIDLEVTGELLPGWQLQGGYNYNENRYNAAFLAAGYGNNGPTYQSQQPKNQFKLWTSYILPGRWQRLTVGGGLRLESARFTAGSVCSVAVDNMGNCPSNVYVPFNFTQGLYTVVDLRAAYRLDDHWQLALNLTNVGDTRYYATAGSSTDGNFYGEPRAFMLSLRGQF